MILSVRIDKIGVCDIWGNRSEPGPLWIQAWIWDLWVSDRNQKPLRVHAWVWDLQGNRHKPGPLWVQTHLSLGVLRKKTGVKKRCETQAGDLLRSGSRTGTFIEPGLGQQSRLKQTWDSKHHRIRYKEATAEGVGWSQDHCGKGMSLVPISKSTWARTTVSLDMSMGPLRD